MKNYTFFELCLWTLAHVTTNCVGANGVGVTVRCARCGLVLVDAVEPVARVAFFAFAFAVVLVVDTVAIDATRRAFHFAPIGTGTGGYERTVRDHVKGLGADNEDIIGLAI